VSSLNATVWSIAFSPTGEAAAVALSDGQLLLYSIPREWTSLSEWTCVKRRLFDPVALPVRDQKRDGCCGGDTACADTNCVDTEHADTEHAGTKCADTEHADTKQDASHSDAEDGGCCGGGGKDTTSTCCQSTQTPAELKIPATELYNVSWNCTGRLLAVATASHSILIVDPHTGHVLAQMVTAHMDEVNAVSWSPTDPALLASCSDDGTLKLWRVAGE
jgi:WD40 repeat protein